VQRFLEKHADKILGTVSIFDRLIFKGYLQGLGFEEGMENFLSRHDVLLKDFRDFTKKQSAVLKDHAQHLAAKAGRPYSYLPDKQRKEALAHAIASKDGITQGLICVLAVTEQCQSYAMRSGEGKPRLARCQPQCLCLYFYYIDRDFGFMHVRLQTWFPFVIQVYVNGHEWLAKQLDEREIGYTKLENAFLGIDDFPAAQQIADDFVRRKWQSILWLFARRVNPLLKTLLHGMDYYWVTDQSEYATDVVFKDKASLKDLYKRLHRHVTVCFGPEDVLRFLGKKPNGNFTGELTTECKKRWQGVRVKHRMKQNYMKMYDKFGVVLRIEVVINHPYDFPIRRWGMHDGEKELGWFPMAKRVSNLYRYAEVSIAACKRYLDALAVVDDPSAAYKLLDGVCEPATYGHRWRRGLNPLRRDDMRLFEAVLRGEHHLRGFTNRDLGALLGYSHPPDAPERRKICAKVTRLIQLLRAHGLIAKVPRSRRYHVSLRGMAIIAAAVHLREDDLPDKIHEQVA